MFDIAPAGFFLQSGSLLKAQTYRQSILSSEQRKKTQEIHGIKVKKKANRVSSTRRIISSCETKHGSIDRRGHSTKNQSVQNENRKHLQHQTTHAHPSQYTGKRLQRRTTRNRRVRIPNHREQPQHQALNLGQRKVDDNRT